MAHRKVEIERRRWLLEEFFRIEEVWLRHERFDGSMTETIRRLRNVRSDAAAVIPYDPEAGRIFLTEQFRYPVHSIGEDPWLLEIPAGVLDPSEEPEDCARRELEEETGLEARSLELVRIFYATPGTSTERVFVYLAEVDGRMLGDRHRWRPEESEDIRVHAFDLDEAWRLLDAGRIPDAKTIIALEWLRRRVSVR